MCLLNAFLGYDPIGYGVPYGHLMIPDDDRESLVEVTGQILALLLDFKPSLPSESTPQSTPLVREYPPGKRVLPW